MISLKKSPLAILQSFTSVAHCTQQVLDSALEQVWIRLDEIHKDGSPLIDMVTAALEELHLVMVGLRNDRKALAVLSAAIGQLYAVRFVLVCVNAAQSPDAREQRPRSDPVADRQRLGAFDRALAYSEFAPHHDRLLAEEWLWQAVLFDPFGGSGIEGLRKLYIQTSIVHQPPASSSDAKACERAREAVARLDQTFGLKNLITGEVNFVDLREFDRTTLHLKGAQHLLSLNAALTSELSRISLFTGLVKPEGSAKVVAPTGLWPLIFLWILLRQFDGVGVHGTSLESLLLFLSSVIKVLGYRDTTHAFSTRYRPPPPTPPHEDGAPLTLSLQFSHCSPHCDLGFHSDSCAHIYKFAKMVLDFIFMMIANVDTDKVGQRVADCQSALLQLLEPPSSPRSSTSSKASGGQSPVSSDSADAETAPSFQTCGGTGSTSRVLWTESEDLMYYSLIPSLLCSCIAALPRTELKKRFAIGICLRRILRILVIKSSPENPLRLSSAINGIFFLIQKDGLLQDLALTGCESARRRDDEPGSRKLIKCRPLRATRRCAMTESTSLDSLTLEHRQTESRALADAVMQMSGIISTTNVHFPASIANIAVPEDRWYYTHTANDLLDFPTCQGILQSDWVFDLVDRGPQLDASQLRLTARPKKRVVSKCLYTPVRLGAQTTPVAGRDSSAAQQHQEAQKILTHLEEYRRRPKVTEGMEFLISELPESLALCRLRLNCQSGDANERDFERARRATLLVALISNTLETAPSWPEMHSGEGEQGAAPAPTTIVVDAANVAFAYGRQKYRSAIFDTEGVLKTINEIKRLGHRPICITSGEFVGTSEEQSAASTSATAASSGIASQRRRSHTRMTENSEAILRQLHLDGELEVTPPGDYDDGYILSFAMRKNACVLSNDKYRDQLPLIAERAVRVKLRNHHHAKLQNCGKCAAELKRETEMTRTWLRKHLITYAFIGDDVIINPTFQLPLG